MILELLSILMKLAPFGLGLLSVTLVLLQWPFVGLLAMVVLIPGEELTTFLGRHTLIWMLGIGVLGAWLLRALLTKEKIRVAKTPLAIAILWLMWGLVSFFWAADQPSVLSRAPTLAGLISFFFLFQVLVKNDRRLRILCSAYFISTVVLGLVAIAIGVITGVNRITLIEAQNPNGFAGALGIGLLMTPYLLSGMKSKRLKFLTLSGATALGIAILMTGSRGVWVGLVAAVAFTWLVTQGKAVRLRYLLASGIVIVLGIAALYSFSIIGDWMIQRIVTLPNLEATHGGSGRLNIWLVGWEMVKANQVIGVGLQNFPARFEQYVDVAGLRGTPGLYPGRGPHNIFLSVQADLGVIGLIVFTGFLWFIFKGLLSYRFDPRGALGLLILIFLVVFGLSGTILYQKPFWLGLGLATVIPMVIQHEEDSSARSELHVS